MVKCIFYTKNNQGAFQMDPNYLINLNFNKTDLLFAIDQIQPSVPEQLVTLNQLKLDSSFFLNIFNNNFIDFTKYFEATSIPLHLISEKNVQLISPESNPEPTSEKGKEKVVEDPKEVIDDSKTVIEDTKEKTRSDVTNEIKPKGILKKTKNAILKKVEFIGRDLVLAFERGEIPEKISLSQVVERLTDYAEDKLPPGRRLRWI